MIMNRWVAGGILAIIVGIISIIYMIYFRKTAIAVRSVVVRNERVGNEYFPVVKIAFGGQEHCIRCNESSKNRKYMEGEEVMVYYKPNNISKVYIVGNNSSFVVDVLMIGVGAIMLLYGLSK